MQGKALPNIEAVDDLDELDLEIVAVLGSNPDATYRDLANKTGRSLQTVFSRVRRMRRSDWVEEMRESLRSLSDSYFSAIQDAVDDAPEAKDRAAVATRVLSGLGVLEDKRSVSIDFSKATDEQIIERLVNMPEEKFNALLAKRADKTPE